MPPSQPPSRAYLSNDLITSLSVYCVLLSTLDACKQPTHEVRSLRQEGDIVVIIVVEIEAAATMGNGGRRGRRCGRVALDTSGQ